jgi:hypothetical protein
MARPKFNINHHQIVRFLYSIEEIAYLVASSGTIIGVCRDSYDDKILECANIHSPSGKDNFCCINRTMHQGEIVANMALTKKRQIAKILKPANILMFEEF